jgi:N-acetylglucosaminyldiphosphoundecaprenol N-acetyl-beta-D-mannosaminyltransferase
MKKLKVIKSMISTGSYSEFVDNIFKLSNKETSSYICISNVHMNIEAYDDDKFLDIVNSANITTPDGMPIAKAIKILYGIHQDRVAGMDLTADIMKKCEQKDMSIFVYGLTDETLKIFEQKALQELPKLRLKTYSPPFRVLSEDEKINNINMINNFNPDFVFVALGCPKQEKWMAEHKGKINSCMIGLGGALEVYAGVKSRAPKWIQNYSLEWLYRLIQDPKRLWKRYLYTNNKFIILFIFQYIKNKVNI